jgi:hypothetical protein
MADNQVLIQIRGDVADINAKLADVTNYVKKMSSEVEKGRNSWQMMSAGIAGAIYIYDQVKAKLAQVVRPLLDMADAAGAAETAENKLRATMAAHGIATDDLVKYYKDLASEYQDLTIYSDEQIIDMERMLTQAGVIPSKMKDAVDATTQLAASGIELDGATKAVAAALEGNYRSLGKLIPAFRNASKGSMSFSDVLRLIREYTGNVAQAEAEGYSGKIKRMANSWDDLKEVLGGHIVPVLKDMIDLTIRGIHAIEEMFGVQTLAWKKKELQYLNEAIAQAEKDSKAFESGKEEDKVFGVTTQGFKGMGLEEMQARRLELEKQIGEEQKKNEEAAKKGDKNFIKPKIDKDADQKLREDWEKTVRELNADIAKVDLLPFDQKLIEIDKKAEDLRAKAEKLPTQKEIDEAKTLIDKWVEAAQGKESTDQAREDFEKMLKLRETAEKSQEERAKKLKALREGEINQRLSELDLAEKEGTFHRDTLEERIQLMQELEVIQEDYLETLDKSKDPSSWYAQKNAVDQTRMKIIELRTEMQPVFENLRKYADEATDVWKNVGTAVSNVFKNMEDQLTEFVVNGKFSFTDFANSVIRDLVRIAIQQSITGPAAKAISEFDWGSLFGSESEAGYAIAPTGATGYGGTAGGYHAGGTVGGRPAFFRIVPSSAIMDALPRRHGGGLASDERLTINKVGERYITEEQNAWLSGLAAMMQKGGSDNRSEVNVYVNVNNKNGSDVQVSEARETNQDLEIDVMVDNAVAKKMSTFGSVSNRTLRQNFGAKERLTGR